MAGLKVKAIYEYTSQEADDLSFPVGQIITITEEIDADWYEGEYTDASGGKQTGIFPSNFVEKYEPEVPVRPARPARPKQDVQSPPQPVAVTKQPGPEEETEEPEPAPQLPTLSKPQPPPVQIPQEAPKPQEELRSPPSAVSQKSPITRHEPAAAPKPTPAEPPATESKKPPPPVAPKSNAFKDRIAAFNQPAAQPIMPFQPSGGRAQPSNFIKKPFVAPPPSSNAYVPPTKQEPVQKPYMREEDPEIKQKQDDDKAAAEAAGFSTEGQQAQEEQAEDAPKPQSLKDRIAMLQKQQAEQAQRRAGGSEKAEKRPPTKKASESSDRGYAAEHEEEELDRMRSPGEERQSLDVNRERPRVPSVQRRPTEPMSPVQDASQHEILSGGEEADQSAAGETTDDDAGTIGPGGSDEKPAPLPRAAGAPLEEPDVGEEEGAADEPVGKVEEEESEDEEDRRRRELRERMAKMSGGMGMAGMFGPPGGMPMPGAGAAKKRSTSAKGKRMSEVPMAPTSPSVEQPQIPMVPVPGMQRVQSPHSDKTQLGVEKEEELGAAPITGQRDPGEVPDVEDVKPEPPPRASVTEERNAPPPVPRERPRSQALDKPPPIPGDRPTARAPPGPPATESRPVPPPPPGAPAPMSPGSESDDEMSMHAKRSSAETPGVETPMPIRGGPPPVPGQRAVPPVPPQSPPSKRASYFGSEGSIPQIPSIDKQPGRMPPIPVTSPLNSPRPPPPPPPGSALPSRQGTGLQQPSSADDERGESDYEGDYDTDIGSGVKHKDALKSHTREESLDESTAAEETPVTSPVVTAPPPLAQRAVPPPPPQAAPKTRQSVDIPRGPPPMPPPRESTGPTEEDYDPYRYPDTARPVPPAPTAIPIAAPPVPPREPESMQEESSDDMYSASPPRKSMDRPPPPPPSQLEEQDRMTPMPPPQQAPPAARGPARQSLDVARPSFSGRRSMDQARPTGDHGQIATELNLSQDTAWWTAAQPLPPTLQGRNGVDVLSECEESTTSKRGGRTTISKDIYILYIDYSQTIINARYDSREPFDVSLEQRQEPPPPKLRQDQLETYWQRFGSKIAAAAQSLGNSKKESAVGDGSPTALVSQLIKAHREALHPVGTRSYGALVYANLANASVMQFDEIRPGDIVTMRNAKLEGKHSGPMHAKYKQDLGAGHVAIVGEWDGTRKKIRAWEQGREKKGGVRLESFRLGDLKSGEVRVWRVVGREWVGWEGES